jgi:hypothetical protein
MNPTMLNAASVMNQCARYTALSVSRLRELASILQISKMTRPLSRTYSDVLDGLGTLSARSHQGFNSRLKGVARELAVVIGISLSMAFMPRVEASIVPIKVLANYQLSDHLYKCHNEIIYRESRWNIDAVNGSHYGYYQLKVKAIQGSPYDYQFYMYWYYVAHRYGFDKANPELPDYCAALRHLKTRGWQ